MPQSNQDFSTARRFNFNNFDCQLPPDVRGELTRPRRPRILKPLTERPARNRLAWLLWFAVLAVFAGALLALLHPTREPAPKQSAPPVQPAPVVQPTPVPAQPTSQPPVPPPPAVSAPRARLVLYKRWAGNGVWELVDSTGRTVKLLIDPTPRAQLVREPEWRVGTSRILYMPYGTEVSATLKGSLSSETFLPRTGNNLGDTWMVGDTPWIWLVTPGTASPQWVDP